MTKQISESLRNHYFSTFAQHGPTPMGVDWGDKKWAADLRMQKILEVITDFTTPCSLLDVGCGYGALLGMLPANHNITYYGIDIASNMIDYANSALSGDSVFFCGDFIEWDPPHEFDYIVCNGILTQKLTSSHLDMLIYSQAVVKKMFEYTRKGVAFNCMSTYVNFQKENLFYRSPSEFIAWCMSELSPHVRLDCSYELWYEYMIYVYKRRA